MISDPGIKPKILAGSRGQSLQAVTQPGTGSRIPDPDPGKSTGAGKKKVIPVFVEKFV